VRNHAARFEEALTALRDGMAHFRAMQPRTGDDGVAGGQGNAAFDEHLRGLAPALRLAPLLEPVSGLGSFAGAAA
jgi:hypothetical protein